MKHQICLWYQTNRCLKTQNIKLFKLSEINILASVIPLHWVMALIWWFMVYGLRLQHLGYKICQDWPASTSKGSLKARHSNSGKWPQTFTFKSFYNKCRIQWHIWFCPCNALLGSDSSSVTHLISTKFFNNSIKAVL